MSVRTRPRGSLVGRKVSDLEAEQQRLQAELKDVEAQRDAQRLVLSPEDIRRMLTEMKETLHGADVKAKRARAGRGRWRGRRVVSWEVVFLSR
jgi:glucose-6-phosphate-specific signal transduction histidine kinase